MGCLGILGWTSNDQARVSGLARVSSSHCTGPPLLTTIRSPWRSPCLSPSGLSLSGEKVRGFTSVQEKHSVYAENGGATFTFVRLIYDRATECDTFLLCSRTFCAGLHRGYIRALLVASARLLFAAGSKGHGALFFCCEGAQCDSVLKTFLNLLKPHYAT